MRENSRRNALKPHCVSTNGNRRTTLTMTLNSIPAYSRKTDWRTLISLRFIAREPMATSYYASAARSLSASSIGADKSASVNSTSLPCASSIPRRTLNPLPRLPSLEITRNCPISLSNERATSAVRSREPSSTTMTSVSRLLSRIYSEIFAKVAGRRASSLKDGMTIESSGAALIEMEIPSIRARQLAEQIGTALGLWSEARDPCARSVATLGFPHRPPGRSSDRQPQAVRPAGPAPTVPPQPQESHRMAPAPANPACHRRNAHEHSRSPGAPAAQTPPLPAPSGIRWCIPRSPGSPELPPDNRNRPRFPAPFCSRSSAAPPSSPRRCRAAKSSGPRQSAVARLHMPVRVARRAQTRSAAPASSPPALLHLGCAGGEFGLQPSPAALPPSPPVTGSPRRRTFRPASRLPNR